MSLQAVWYKIGERVGFHTSETAQTIPSTPGIYAWFFPLHIFDDDLDAWMKRIQEVYMYDTSCRGRSAGDVDHEFHWDTLKCHFEKHPHKKLGDVIRKEWRTVISDQRQRAAFRKVLMEASVLMPPLYVGKADNLKARYDQHVKGSGREADDFHKRFQEYAQANNIPLMITDLLFVCIETDQQSAKTLYHEDKLNWLLEQVMMRVAHPPFSVK
jgi:hypothetical protein